MNKMIVPSQGEASPAEVLDGLAGALETLTPELRKAASYVLEHPNDVGVSSIREIAEAAGVKPNTFVRLARAIGYEGYEPLRQPFREAIRQGREDFPDRARWLQSLGQGGKLDSLYAELASASISNIESLFSATDAASMKAAADAIISARTTYVLGVGIANALARNFAYLAGMAVGNIRAIPRDGSLPVDGLVRANEGDVLLAMTFKPYRREVVEAVEAAREQKLTIIGVSDSLASPVFQGATHRFAVPVNSPQFFTSTTALSAFLETLMAFVIADAGTDVISNIERFHSRRHELGIYMDDDAG